MIKKFLGKTKESLTADKEITLKTNTTKYKKEREISGDTNRKYKKV